MTINSENLILLSIVIPNYNKSYYTKICIESLLENALSERYLKDIEIIIISNGSSGEDLKNLECFESNNVRIIRNETNLGFAGGNNLGCSIARGKLIMFLSHDTMVTPGWFRELVKVFEEHPDIGAGQCKLVEMRDKETIQSSGTKINLWFGNVIPDKGRGQKNSSYRAKLQDTAGCGAALVIRRDVIALLDTVFDEDYFVNFEDMDLSFRIFLLGYRVVLLPNSVVYHHDHNSNKLSDKESIFRRYHTIKNVIFTYIKDLELHNLLFNLVAFILSNFIISLAQALYRRNQMYIVIYFKAILWDLKHIGLILKKRKIIQGNRKVSDNYIFSRICSNFG